MNEISHVRGGTVNGIARTYVIRGCKPFGLRAPIGYIRMEKFATLWKCWKFLIEIKINKNN